MSLELMLRPRLVELGKIKIGTLGESRTSRGGGSYRMPKKLDHFLITTMNRDADGMLEQDHALMERLAAAHGSPDGKLREIPICLLSDVDEDCIQSAYVCYNGKSCAARSDGKTLTKFVDMSTGKVLPEPVQMPWDPDLLTKKNSKGAPLFKKHTVLNCVITAEDARWGGVYKFRTTSNITGDQLLGSLLHIKSLTNGVVSGLPLRLVVRPMQVAPDGKPTTVYVCHVELRGQDLQAIQNKALELATFRLQYRQEVTRAQLGLRRLLVAPGEESVQEITDVTSEFLPDDDGDRNEEPELSNLLDDAELPVEKDEHEQQHELPPDNAIDAEYEPASDPEPEHDEPSGSLFDADDDEPVQPPPAEPDAFAGLSWEATDTQETWHKRISIAIMATSNPERLDAIRQALEQYTTDGTLKPMRQKALKQQLQQRLTEVG